MALDDPEVVEWAMSFSDDQVRLDAGPVLVGREWRRRALLDEFRGWNLMCAAETSRVRP